MESEIVTIKSPEELHQSLIKNGSKTYDLEEIKKNKKISEHMINELKLLKSNSSSPDEKGIFNSYIILEVAPQHRKFFISIALKLFEKTFKQSQAILQLKQKSLE
jgi:hypothetical protein